VASFQLHVGTLNVTIQLFSSAAAWEETANTDYPGLYLYKANLDAYIVSLAKCLFADVGSPLLKNFDQCAAMQLADLSFALRHPSVLSETIATLQTLISSALGASPISALPSVPGFYVYGGNDMRSLAPDAAQFCKDWQTDYKRDFGEPPLPTSVTATKGLSPGNLKLPIGGPPLPTSVNATGAFDIVFCNLGSIRGMTAVGWPIFFNQAIWRNGSDVFRRSLAAHEMFHRLQYAFGLYTSRPPGAQSAWFVEGGASWAESVYNHAVTSDQKILASLSHPQISLLESSYYACLPWLGTSRTYSEMKSMLQRFDAGATIASFADDVMREKLWSIDNVKDAGTGQPLEPEASGKVIQLGVTPLPFTTVGAVSGYAADLYRVDVNGFTGSLAVQTSGVGYKIWPNVAPPPLSQLLLPVTGKTEFWIEIDGGTAPLTPYTLEIRDSATPASSLSPPATRPPVAPASSVLPLPYNSRAWIDNLGNVSINSQGSTVELGFEIESYASLGTQAPADPGAFVDCWQTPVPGTPVSSSSVVNCALKASFSCSVSQLTRELTLTKNQLGVPTLEIQTVLDSTAETIYYVLIVGARKGVPPNINWDGQETVMCDPKNDQNDGECRPVFPVTITVDGQAPRPGPDPIVPNVGRIWLPIPIPTGHHTIIESYILTKEI
jgi:hypothetical protein